MSGVTTEVRVEGDTQLTRRLSALGAEIKDLRGTVAELAREAAAQAAALAPQRSGALRASIHPAPARPNLARVVADAPYAGMINYGWPERNIPAANFLARTDAVMQPRALRRVQSAVDRLIDSKGLG